MLFIDWSVALCPFIVCPSSSHMDGDFVFNIKSENDNKSKVTAPKDRASNLAVTSEEFSVDRKKTKAKSIEHAMRVKKSNLVKRLPNADASSVEGTNMKPVGKVIRVKKSNLVKRLPNTDASSVEGTNMKPVGKVIRVKKSDLVKRLPNTDASGIKGTNMKPDGQVIRVKKSESFDRLPKIKSSKEIDKKQRDTGINGLKFGEEPLSKNPLQVGLSAKQHPAQEELLKVLR